MGTGNRSAPPAHRVVKGRALALARVVEMPVGAGQTADTSPARRRACTQTAARWCGGTLNRSAICPTVSSSPSRLMTRFLPAPRVDSVTARGLVTRTVFGGLEAGRVRRRCAHALVVPTGRGTPFAGPERRSTMTTESLIRDGELARSEEHTVVRALDRKST